MTYKYKSIRWLVACLACLLCSSLVGCSRDPLADQVGCKSSPVPCLYKSVKVILETTKGSIQIRLDGENAPLTSGNFLDLVRKNVYNNTVFHRVVKTPVPFVVQGGDPTSSDPKTPANTYGSGHFVDSRTGEARYIPLELKLKSSQKILYAREIDASTSPQKLVLTHDRGSVAMARSSDPNSASAQFYIALEALPELDGRYAVFGQVVGGMDVVDKLQQGDRLIRATVVSD